MTSMTIIIIIIVITITIIIIITIITIINYILIHMLTRFGFNMALALSSCFFPQILLFSPIPSFFGTFSRLSQHN